MELKQAVKVFAHGFAATRSRTHPCLARRVGPLWYLHDAPRKNPTKMRGAEFIACGSRPPTVMRHIRATAAPRWALCVIHPGPGRDASIESAYKSAGLRYVSHEPVFVAEPTVVLHATRGPCAVRRATSADEAKRVAKAAGARQLLESEVDDDAARPRLFAAFEGEEPIGWVTSVRVGATHAWVQNLYVIRERRGRGIGRALMTTMLHDDAERGVTHSVLTASSAGARLYPKVGYHQVGTLLFFRPPKRGD
ncbi:MAG: GNAT family N-acetyltransferase [Planctomycetota bacterium]